MTTERKRKDAKSVVRSTSSRVMVRDPMRRYRTYRAQREYHRSQQIGNLHFCGEAHAAVYLSRWFDSECSPSKPDFTK